jgi:hypothetical protein
MDSLRSRGIFSADDDMIVTWKRSWLPNLMRSEVGHWMLDNGLLDYYSETMVKDLRDAAGPAPVSASPRASPKTGSH